MVWFDGQVTDYFPSNKISLSGAKRDKTAMNSRVSKRALLTRSTLTVDDGLYTPVVGRWAEYKYDLIGLYNDLFSTGMKGKWDKRVYIDLFAGAGKVRIRHANRVLLGSPLIALSVADKYDRYIFCDQDGAALEALRHRVEKNVYGLDVHFVPGDCNRMVDQISSLIPKPSKAQRVLSFCFVDPFSLNIEFETIKSLSEYFVDFLILLALAMDAGRNEERYVQEQNERIEKFLGISDWRDQWQAQRKKDPSIRRFLAKEYGRQMVLLGFRNESVGSMIEIRSDEKNLPLYHLAFFLRHQRGYDFWEKVRQFSVQPRLF
jgi:three-Cys-motif partner protein